MSYKTIINAWTYILYHYVIKSHYPHVSPHPLMYRLSGLAIPISPENRLDTRYLNRCADQPMGILVNRQLGSDNADVDSHDRALHPGREKSNRGSGCLGYDFFNRLFA